jgi:hypothetical protein
VSELITHTARLVPYATRPKQVSSFVTAYSYEPLADEPGAQLGNLYVVMEVLVSGRASEEVADLVIETAGDRYYNEPTPDTTPLMRFEAAIKAVNHELSEHVNKGNASWIGKLSAVIAIQIGHELHIAQTGSAEAFLYRGKAATQISSNEHNRPNTPNKTFGTIATGQLDAGDRLLLATPALIHQVPLERLQSIISQSGPNASIAEITELLKGVSIDRIAGLVLEITTPERAALQVRSEQPNEIRLGGPDNALEAAKMAATPIAQSTVTSSKRVVRVAHSSIKKAQPRARAAGLAAAALLRRLLSTGKGRRIAAAVTSVVIIATIALAIYHNQSANTAQYFEKYQAAYNNFVRAQQQLDNGSKTDARDGFENVRAQLNELKPRQHQIDTKLAHSTIPEQEPRTFSAFEAIVGNLIDQIDGLVKAQATTVASFNTKDGITTHFEVRADKAYAFTNHSLSIVSLSTGAVIPSRADLSKVGNVINTTLSGSDDGIYVLTDKPSVWFYRFDTDTITEQQVSYGQWPKAKAIASYANNIYLLGDAFIYKHVKTSTGFSPKTEYVSLSSEEGRDSSALAVDGFVYLASASGLHRYMAAALKQSAPVPDAVGQVTQLRSLADGKIIIGAGPSSGRISVWKSSETSLLFNKQIAVSNVKKLYDATYDPKSGNVYALADNRLVRFTIPL